MITLRQLCVLRMAPEVILAMDEGMYDGKVSSAVSQSPLNSASSISTVQYCSFARNLRYDAGPDVASSVRKRWIRIMFYSSPF